MIGVGSTDNLKEFKLIRTKTVHFNSKEIDQSYKALASCNQQRRLVRGPVLWELTTHETGQGQDTCDGRYPRPSSESSYHACPYRKLWWTSRWSVNFRSWLKQGAHKNMYNATHIKHFKLKTTSFCMNYCPVANLVVQSLKGREYLRHPGGHQVQNSSVIVALPPWQFLATRLSVSTEFVQLS